MTTIRNKQTGETLTGLFGTTYGTPGIFWFEIKGCSGSVGLRESEWDILPPPLPTGIGAVVSDAHGRNFVRTFSNSVNPWVIANGALRVSNIEISEHNGPVTILSPGVEL